MDPQFELDSFIIRKGTQFTLGISRSNLLIVRVDVLNTALEPTCLDRQQYDSRPNKRHLHIIIDFQSALHTHCVIAQFRQ